MSDDKTTVLHLRVPSDIHLILRQLGMGLGVPVATQARLLILEALKARKLIK